MEQANKKTDTLFADDLAPRQFVFDERVAAVFDDMINRSVPGYATIVNMIGSLAQRYCQEGTAVYDLGCSLGAATFAMAANINCADFRIHAIDNSEAMLERLQQRLADSGFDEKVTARCEDILATEISNASVVVLNFTLQFIEPAARAELLQRIYQGMTAGGVLIISEKILFPDPQVNALFVDLHHRFKQSMGYSEMEISRKRSALEQVLIPETIDAHRQRLLNAGFKTVDLWFQCFNFASMVAFK